MILRPFLVEDTSCASYLFGCTSQHELAVVDPHADLVDRYVEAAAAIGSPIVAVLETHVQADHRSGLPMLVERTGALAYLPDGASVCGRGLSGHPFSTIGFERRHNRALQHADVDAFVEALLVDVPPAPVNQAAIVAANLSGRAQQAA